MWQTKCVEVNNSGQYLKKDKHGAGEWIALSRLGQKGWELVNVFFDSTENKKYAWLKRQQGERFAAFPGFVNWDEV